MSDYLVDLIVIRKDGSSVYYEEVPEPWLARFTKGCAGAVMIKFMFSDKQAWTWDLQFNFSQVQRKEGLFIHPVLTPLQPRANGGGRRRRCGQFTSRRMYRGGGYLMTT